MTPSADLDKLTKLIETGSMQACLEFFADKSPEERRPFAKLSIKKYKDADREWLSEGGDPRARRPGRNSIWDEQENAKVCILASATPGELRKLGWRVVPRDGFVLDVIRTLQPDWASNWTQELVENEPRMFNDIRLLYQAGLCDKPAGDGYILGMIECLPGWAHVHPGLWDKDMSLADRIRTTPDIRDDDVWRLFEVEGGGDLSLATFDKYIGGKKVGGWTEALTELSEDGTLSRDRLLDESLRALERDFAQFRAGWFSRFHEHLEPTLDERAARRDQYLRLLGSTIPPTVSFALKAIALLDKAGELPPEDLLASLRPVLQARAKGTVTTGLRLLANAAKRAPDLAAKKARLATEALIHEAADVQKKALDVIDSLAGKGDPAISAAMLAFADGIAPSVRKRFEELAGDTGAPLHDDSPAASSPVQQVVSVEPVESFAELNHALLQVLEDTSDPLAVERVLDGLARHGADRPTDFSKVMGPLGKRANAIIKRQSLDQTQYQLARLIHAYVFDENLSEDDEVRYPEAVLGAFAGQKERQQYSFEGVFVRRNIDLLTQVRSGHRLPLLGAPTDSRGFVAADVLIARYDDYKKTKVEPGPTDMALALMRLSPEERDTALAELAQDDDYERAIAFALGADVSPGKVDWLWVAAAAARLPYEDQPAIAKKHGRRNPDAGTKAQYAIRFKKDKYFTWLGVFVEPKIRKTVPKTHIATLFHMTTAGDRSYGSVCGFHVNMIRWCSTVWPLNQEALFSQGVLIFDHSQRLANTPYVGFIEPMLESHVAIGQMGAALLVLSLASSDPAVKGVALDAAIASINEGRLVPEFMRQTLAALVPSGHAPVGRWTKSLTELAGVSEEHAVFVRNLITGSLRHDPCEAPRDMGGLVELLNELSVATSTPITDARSLEFLRGVTGGGKLKRFAGKLLALG